LKEEKRRKKILKYQSIYMCFLDKKKGVTCKDEYSLKEGQMFVTDEKKKATSSTFIYKEFFL
jgi:hypothetical protein